MFNIFQQIRNVFRKKDSERGSERGRKEALKYIIENEKMPSGFSEENEVYLKKSFKDFIMNELKPCSEQAEREIDKCLEENDFSSILKIVDQTKKLREL